MSVIVEEWTKSVKRREEKEVHIAAKKGERREYPKSSIAWKGWPLDWAMPIHL